MIADVNAYERIKTALEIPDRPIILSYGLQLV